MRFNPKIWTPIAQVLAAVNVAAVYFAARDTEPIHALAHAALGAACMLWAERLRARATRALYDAEMAQADLMPGEMDHVHHELADVQERLDFAERMLTQRHEQDRVPQKGP
jgi:HPt (histidine-containing phosphotransfer) domain-containing protein